MGLQDQPLNVLTHGFVLGQYGMLWALQHSDAVVKLMVMNVPLGKKAQLRPELAKYKAAMPFMRPKADAKVAGDLYNASGLAYVIQYDDAQVRAARPGAEFASRCRRWHGIHSAARGRACTQAVQVGWRVRTQQDLCRSFCHRLQGPVDRRVLFGRRIGADP